MDEKTARLSPQLIDVDALAYDVRWLIRLRWVAVGTVAVTLVVGYWLGWMDSLAPPVVVAAGLGLLNTWWYLSSRSKARATDPGDTAYWRRHVMLQLHFDMLALTFLLHWTGGFENPFSSLYVFPVAIASMLLPFRHALLVFGSSFTLFLALIVCEVATAGRHRPFTPSDQLDGADAYDAIALNPWFLTGVGVARFLTLGGTLIFLSMLLTRLRRTEARRRRQEQIALARERLARVGTISAGLTHSIRNPLHGALNCIALLRDPVSKEEHSATIDMLEEGLLRIETVTRRLMDMTREAPFTPTATDLREWIASFLQPFHLRNYTDKEVAISTDMQPVPIVHIDRHRIYECLFNVVSNAIDSLPATGGRVEIGLRPIRDPLPGVAITVTDNGHGIPPDVLARVFDPFFTTKPIGEGTGLGLSIAREEVERHGGEVVITPLTEGGTRVTIALPENPFEGN